MNPDGTDVIARDSTAIPVIERRIAELKEQRQRDQERARLQDAAVSGAIQGLEALLVELTEEEE